MNGTIIFDDLAELAEFLREFTGSTATFEVTRYQTNYLLKFTGGF